jgi:hypothetical protein
VFDVLTKEEVLTKEGGGQKRTKVGRTFVRPFVRPFVRGAKNTFVRLLSALFIRPGVWKNLKKVVDVFRGWRIRSSSAQKGAKTKQPQPRKKP